MRKSAYLFCRKFSIIYNTKLIIPYSQERFISVAKRTEDYKYVLPFCSQSKEIWNTSRDINDLKGEYIADLTISAGIINFQYFSHVFYDPSSVIIKKCYQDKNFTILNASWKTKAISHNRCELDYNFTFELANSMYHEIAKILHNIIANQLNKAFLERCNYLEKKEKAKTKKNEVILQIVEFERKKLITEKEASRLKELMKQESIFNIILDVHTLCYKDPILENFYVNQLHKLSFKCFR